MSSGCTDVPNPALDEASCRITLVESEQVSLILSDATGKRLLDLPNRIVPAGRTSLTIPVNGLPSGFYFIQVKSAGATVLLPLTVRRAMQLSDRTPSSVRGRRNVAMYGPRSQGPIIPDRSAT